MSKRASDPILFALDAFDDLGERVAKSGGFELGQVEKRFFEDGEHKFRSLTEVRGRPAVVFESLYAQEDVSVNDRLIQLVFFVGALKDAGAKEVTLVLPYLCYSRKDRRTKHQDPVTTRYLAQILECSGFSLLTTLEYHNLSALENSFRRPVFHLPMSHVFVPELAQLIQSKTAVVASPDVGGIKRAEEFRIRLEQQTGQSLGKAFMEKRRSEGKVSGDILVGDVKDQIVLLIDDMISTGGTMAKAARACMASGAKEVWLVAAHGLLNSGAEKVLQEESVARVFLADSIPLRRSFPQAVEQKITFVSTVEHWAQVVRYLCLGGEPVL